MKILCPLSTLVRLALWLTALGVVLGVAMTAEPAAAPAKPAEISVHSAR
ncbi:hypothetical protein [Amycolatopsis albispora]|nr:hypothetical protein [Amycolatopsis albispora]